MSYNQLNYLRGYLVGKNMIMSLKALNFAETLRQGQVRSGNKEPYFYHPVKVASLLASLGIDDDTVIATALLHDTVEDCGIEASNLAEHGMNSDVIDAVELLTKKKTVYNNVCNIDNDSYYHAITDNKIASIIKLADRCHNLSTMGDAFSIRKMKSYIQETKDYTYVLLKATQWSYPEFTQSCFIMKLIFDAVIDNLDPILAKIDDKKS